MESPAIGRGGGGGGGGESGGTAETIQVFARVRPFIDRENQDSCPVELENAEQHVISISTPSGKRSLYQFDRILLPSAQQEEVFHSVLPLIKASIGGYNTTVAAYGQTGTGKTHTMLGVDMWTLASGGDEELSAVEVKSAWGTIPRSMDYIFTRLHALDPSGTATEVSCSYVEIYNEKVYDLLNYETSKALKSGLDIQQHPDKGVSVSGAVEVTVGSIRDVLDLLWRGARNRATSATDMNLHSSRSHTIFQVSIQRRQEEGHIVRSKVNLVDLAGSEKWRPHQFSSFTQDRITEMTSINQSLSALGNCIRALGDRSRTHIPYRNSKLTRLLQDSLGGNTKTCFIVTISPALESVEETISTLQFADRAKKVVLHTSVNEMLDDPSVIRRYEHQIARLKSLLQGAVRNNGVPPSPSVNFLDGNDMASAEVEDVKAENSRLKEELFRVRERLLTAEDEVLSVLAAVSGASRAEDVIPAASLAMRYSLSKREEELRKRELSFEAEKKQLHDRLAAIEAVELSTQEDGMVMTLDAKLKVFEAAIAGARQDLTSAKQRFRDEVLNYQEMAALRSADAKAIGDRLSQVLKEKSGKGAQPKSAASSAWIKHIDPKTQRSYYYNKNSGVSQWEKPAELEDEGLKFDSSDLTKKISKYNEQVYAEVQDVCDNNAQRLVASIQKVLAEAGEGQGSKDTGMLPILVEHLQRLQDEVLEKHGVLLNSLAADLGLR